MKRTFWIEEAGHVSHLPIPKRVHKLEPHPDHSGNVQKPLLMNGITMGFWEYSCPFYTPQCQHWIISNCHLQSFDQSFEAPEKTFGFDFSGERRGVPYGIGAAQAPTSLPGHACAPCENVRGWVLIHGARPFHCHRDILRRRPIDPIGMVIHCWMIVGHFNQNVIQEIGFWVRYCMGFGEIWCKNTTQNNTYSICGNLQAEFLHRTLVLPSREGKRDIPIKMLWILCRMGACIDTYREVVFQWTWIVPHTAIPHPEWQVLFSDLGLYTVGAGFIPRRRTPVSFLDLGPQEHPWSRSPGAAWVRVLFCPIWGIDFVTHVNVDTRQHSATTILTYKESNSPYDWFHTRFSMAGWLPVHPLRRWHTCEECELFASGLHPVYEWPQETTSGTSGNTSRAKIRTLPFS